MAHIKTSSFVVKTKIIKYVSCKKFNDSNKCPHSLNQPYEYIHIIVKCCLLIVNDIAKIGANCYFYCQIVKCCAQSFQWCLFLLLDKTDYCANNESKFLPV